MEHKERLKKNRVEGKQGPITQNEIEDAAERLREYARGKATIDQKATATQEWWRGRHWAQSTKKNDADDEKPTSAWLFNSLINKHADMMDNYPKPNILPRAADDEMDAETLSKIVPVILEQNKHRKVYSKAAYDFVSDGGCITSVTWDNTKYDGLGDIAISQVDIHNIFWKPGINDIQESPEIFIVDARDNEELIREYPQLEGKTGKTLTKVSYIHDDYTDEDTDQMSYVVDWYYKVKRIDEVEIDGVVLPRPKTILHYCKFCNGEILYSSENEEGMEDGFYEHGMFPVVFRVLFPVKDTPWGFGYVNVMKNPQMYVDALDQMINKNAFMKSRPRWWVREDAGFNEEDFADWSKTFVKFAGGNIEDVMKEVEVPTIPAFVVNHKMNKIDELKETSGNRDFSQGSTQSGVTAASAIAALQEAGSKLARDMIRAGYEGYEEEVYLVIELIRQFYTEERSFRIDSDNGQYEFVPYSNRNISTENSRKPIFDIKVVAEKQSPFSRAAQNETIKELYGMGLFAPANAEPALVCLDAMEFEGRDAIKQQVQRNSLMMQQLQRMQAVIMQADALVPQLQLAVQAGLAEPQPMQTAPMNRGESSTPEERVAQNKGESATTAKARERAASQASV